MRIYSTLLVMQYETLYRWSIRRLTTAVTWSKLRQGNILIFIWLYLVRSRLCYSVASVCLSSVDGCTECIVAKRCVLEQKLLLTACRNSHMRNWLVPKWMTLTFV